MHYCIMFSPPAGTLMDKRLVHGLGKHGAAARRRAIKVQDSAGRWLSAADTQTRLARRATVGPGMRALGRTRGQDKEQEVVETSRGPSTV